MYIQQLNALEKPELKEALFKCCGSTEWVNRLSNLFPVRDEQQLFNAAEKIWYVLPENDWREAFTHHPKIGDINSLKEKFAATAHWAAGEQAAVNQTSEDILRELALGNQLYEKKFGYIFIVCATGKSAEEMLALLNERLPNSRETEIKIAMAEQNKITRIRLEKLLAK